MSVFISYRRDGGKPVAEAIYQALCKDYNIFLDTESLRNGRFDSAITDQIKSCSDFLLIVTQTVFDRCAEPDDWILNEAQIALQENKNIIPVFVGLQNFPLNVPETLQEICSYNGVFWNDTDTVYAKIKTFLVSNRRYKLSVIKSGDGIALSPQTKEDLKELYRRFLKNGRKPTDIEIFVPNPNELSELITRQDVIRNYGIDTATRIAERSLLKKIKLIKGTLETAVEIMLQDEMADSCAIRLKDLYIKRYGIANCFFDDEDGIEACYWTPFLWFDIIEEMLKELLFDRYNIYGSSDEFTEIDCFIENQNRNEIWSFRSFIKKPSECNSDVQSFDITNIIRRCGDYMDIPLQSLAFYVYPDLYYNIALLKNGQTVQSYEIVSQYADVFNLWHYRFGLH